MKRPPDTHEREVRNREDEHPKNVDVEESEIDQILADSFLASDAPQWTLGVTSPRPKGVRKRKER